MSKTRGYQRSCPVAIGYGSIKHASSAAAVCLYKLPQDDREYTRWRIRRINQRIWISTESVWFTLTKTEKLYRTLPTLQIVFFRPVDCRPGARFSKNHKTMIIKSSQIRHNFVIRSPQEIVKVTIVNKNSNQSRALKLVCLHMCRPVDHTQKISACNWNTHPTARSAGTASPTKRFMFPSKKPKT